MFTKLFLTDSLQEPVTNKDITAAEEQLGVTLPADFVLLMKQSNGGYVNYDKRAFPVDFSIESGDIFIEVEEIMGIHEEGLLSSTYLAEEWDLPQKSGSILRKWSRLGRF